MNQNIPLTTSGSPPTSLPCIHDLFASQALGTPDATAVTCGPAGLTYSELNQRSNQLAQRLRKYGVSAEVPVGLYLDRSLDMVVAILAVLKAGGCYVPIDLAYPKDRVAFMLDDAQAPVLVTQANLKNALPQFGGHVVCIDADWEGIAAEKPALPDPTTTPENAAYIIYTSGSTGTPKGVVVTHHNVVRLLQQTAPWYQFTAQDVWPLFHSYAFDVSVWELWGALFNGGRLVVVPYLITRSPSEFYNLLADEKVTVLNQTPSAFRQLIWAEESAPIKRQLKLRYVICAGEALELQSLKPWFDRHGDERPLIVNMYGITETTVHSTYRPIRKVDLASGVGSVIGVPIPDLKIYLLDEHLQPVRKGRPGEICVGGAGVARGYLKRPELHAQRFLSDPFSHEPGARMYRSGDLAQVNDRGEMEYLGRMDHQVKIRGFRVELGEIESALHRHPAIRESVVLAREDGSGGKRLVAYIVPDDRVPNVTELREFLAPKIPDYMIPARFVILQRFPLTTNGKIDRRALPDPDAARPELKARFVEPATPAEGILARIWSEVLGVEKVGTRDNFFELGGDSIRSIQVLAKAQDGGINLKLEQIFQHPTIEQLALCSTSASVPTRRKRIEPFALLSSADRQELNGQYEDAYPIASLQLGMFFHNELDPLSAMYHDVFSFVICSAFDRDKLAAAIRSIAQRHPILRTSFHLAGFSQPLQLVHRNVEVPFTVEDVRARPPEEQEKRITDWIQIEKRRPFDRSVPPLVRFHAQVQTAEKFQFFISFHHSCIDGWSLAALITEIFQTYAAALQNCELEVRPPQVRYADFVALERETLQSEQARHFWAKKLEGANPQRLPRWPKTTREGGHEQRRGPELDIAPEVFAGLRQLAQAAGVPLKTVLLAAHQRVMAYLGANPDVISGLVCNGRPEEVDGEKLLGLFLNTVPIRQHLAGGTWLELVQQTFAAEQQLVPHRRFPVAELHKLHGGQPLFETAFDFVHFHVYEKLQGEQAIDVAEGHYFEANNLTTYTTFMLDVSSTHLQLHLDYDPNKIARPQIEQITEYYLATLRAMAADFNGRYETFCPLSTAEQQRILQEWNATQEKYPESTCIHELFEAQAEQRPQAIAVVCGNQKLTYAELNQAANRVAGALADVGLHPGSLAGIYIERSANMLIGLLGILKSGAAYVPLDPGFPRERLEYMLEDASISVLLTQRSLLDSLTTPAPVLCIDALLAPPQQTPAAEALKSNVRPSRSAVSSSGSDSLAYVIYTSGSTGKPKGVQVNHRSVVNVLTSIARQTEFSASDNLLAVTTLSFDIAGLELFMPLFVGATVTIATREAAGDGVQLASLIEGSGATVMQATPATWRLLIESGWKGNQNLKVFCGGEALKRDLANELLKRSAAVWNFYGPTETTIWSTAARVAEHGPVSIGRPLANTQCYILDPNLLPLPVGGIGELYLAGDGLSPGYLNRPELTSDKFIANPLATGGNAKMYRTGDLARYLPEGTIECLGRVDHQVKVRGFRIELGEIESVLRQHSGIADALVSAREDSSGEHRLVAYVISRNHPPAISELRDHLKTKLPLYMVPAQFVCLEEFPLLPNGKIDRKRLPAPETSAAAIAPYVAPESPEEDRLARIWEEVLELRQVSVADNLFELGADSLSATRAFARINRAFGTEISLREVFENPTIRALAELVRTSPRTAITGRTVVPKRPRATIPA